jgi:hypothetical protein
MTTTRGRFVHILLKSSVNFLFIAFPVWALPGGWLAFCLDEFDQAGTGAPNRVHYTLNPFAAVGAGGIFYGCTTAMVGSA